MRFVSVFIFSTVLIAGDWAHAQVNCAAVFVETPKASGADFGALRADFEHKRTYSNELHKSGDIKDQCALGTCHLYSWSSSLEQSFQSRNGRSIAISARYLTVMHWMDSAVRTLKLEDPTAKIQLGANPMFSRFQIMRFGAMPEATFKPARDFDKPPLSGRIQTYLQNIVDRAKFELKSTSDVKARADILQKAQADILSIFVDITGDVPKKFTFEGKEYEPRSFAAAMFPELTKPVVFMMLRSGRDLHDTQTEVNARYSRFETSIDVVERTTKELIDKGEAVYLSYDHQASYVDKETGIMSLSAFAFPTNARPLSRRQRDWSEREAGGHAVQIVGYDLDPQTGRIIKFKIKNSWGDKAGDAGHYHMYADYFRSFARGITFYQGAVKLPDAYKEATQRELPF